MNDDEKSKVLPTRHSDTRPDGGAMGAAQERQMRASVPDTNSFNTRFMENADGSTTRLRTRGGMCEYVTEQLPVSYGQTCKLNIDSGIVDLLDASALGTAYHDHSSGILYRTQYVQQVASGPIGGITGPVIGEIKPPKSAGTAPDDGHPAESFLASATLGSPYGKKRMAALVPPSIFTGKMRMYMQALYGRHDHADFLMFPEYQTETPSLLADWTGRFEANSVLLDTNCGIHTNLSTGEHSLIKVGASSAKIYKLIPSSCAKQLRASMLATTTPTGDKERIEAYILSQSKIDVASVIKLQLDISVPALSMGYGWHFNWDGDRCDIVHNSLVHYGGINYENESTHYRLSFSKNSFGAWSHTAQIVEGPTRWKSLRNIEPIVFPNWMFNTLEKIGSGSIGPLPHGDAPFYVFYNRNALKVCKYSAPTSTYAKTGITREPWYYWQGQYMSVGTDAVSWRTREEWSGATITISCGEYSVSYQQGSYTDNVYTRESPDPSDIVHKAVTGQETAYTNGFVYSPVGQPETIETSAVYDEYFGTIQRYKGAGGLTGLSNWPIQENELYNVRRIWGPLYVRAPSETFSQAVDLSTEFLAAVPFYDAEAIYLYGKQTKTAVDTGTGETEHGSWFQWTGTVEGNDIYAITGLATDGKYNLSNQENFHSINRTATTTSSVAKLVCGVGTFDAALPGLSAFFSSEDMVQQQYPTYTSASGEAVLAPHNGIDSGNSAIADPDTFVYVGWA